MADIDIIEETSGAEEEEDVAGQEALMAAGAAEVHEESAGEAAEEAEAAAEAAVEAAAVNAASVGAAESAAASAAESANAAQSGAQAVAEALQAQTAVLESLLTEVRASRETSESPVEKEKPKQTADRPPSTKKRRGSWYYGK